MTTPRFIDRSVFITGGAAGIGLATALAFAAEGGRVAIADVNDVAGEEAARKIRNNGGTALFLKADATNETDVKTAIAAACSAHGPIRHAFNNVGAPRGSTIEATSLEEWEWTIRVSLTSVFLGMKHEIPVMRAAGGGTIVNTASNTASIIITASAPGYTTAKAGVMHLTRYGSVALGKDNIRVNSVSPGLTATDLILKRHPPERQQAITRSSQIFARLVRPEEIATAVLYLSSDDAAMVTGRDLEVGGGRLF